MANYYEEMDNHEDDLVKRLCDQIGYGNVMRRASALWDQKIVRVNDVGKAGAKGSHFLVGPCAIGTVPCECEQPHKCDWCNGCGWLTKHVKSIKESRNKKN